MATEIWKPVVGFEDSYEVSSLGRVRSLDRVVVMNSRWGKPVAKNLKGKFLAPTLNGHGYPNVMLGAGNMCRVHRLVAEAFIPNPDELPQVNHLDGNRANSKVENLEWTDASGNNTHAYRVSGRLPSKMVAVQVSSAGAGVWFPSVSEAARCLGFNFQGLYWALANTGRYRGMEVVYG